MTDEFLSIEELTHRNKLTHGKVLTVTKEYLVALDFYVSGLRLSGKGRRHYVQDQHFAQAPTGHLVFKPLTVHPLEKLYVISWDVARKM